MIPFLDLAKRNARYVDAFAAATRAALARQLVLGEEVARFEKAWSAYCDKRHCVGVGNGYDALLLMLRAAGIGPQCQVMVQTNAHVSAWLAVDATGARVVPVEPDPHSLLLDAGHVVDVARSVGGVDAVLVTFLYGRVPDMLTLTKAAHTLGAHVLVDAAQAHGIGGALLGDAAAFSFYPTKNLGALGDAGAVVTNNPLLAGRVREFRNYGGAERNVHTLRYGVNSRLDELQAAFLNIKLPQLDKDNARRARIARTYERALCVPTPTMFPDVHHLFVVRSQQRAAVMERLAALGVETAVYYPTPPHLQPAFRHLGYERGSFPIAETHAREVFSVPSGPELSDAEVHCVAQALRSLVSAEAMT